MLLYSKSSLVGSNGKVDFGLTVVALVFKDGDGDGLLLGVCLAAAGAYGNPVRKIS